MFCSATPGGRRGLRARRGKHSLWAASGSRGTMGRAFGMGVPRKLGQGLHRRSDEDAAPVNAPDKAMQTNINIATRLAPALARISFTALMFAVYLYPRYSFLPAPVRVNPHPVHPLSSSSFVHDSVACPAGLRPRDT